VGGREKWEQCGQNLRRRLRRGKQVAEFAESDRGRAGRMVRFLGGVFVGWYDYYWSRKRGCVFRLGVL
jgi:hypothetical protein